MKLFAAAALTLFLASVAHAAPIYLTATGTLSLADGSGATAGVDPFYLSIELDDGGLGLENRTFGLFDVSGGFDAFGVIIAQAGRTRVTVSGADFDRDGINGSNFTLTTDATGQIDTVDINLRDVSDPFLSLAFLSNIIFRDSAALAEGIDFTRPDPNTPSTDTPFRFITNDSIGAFTLQLTTERVIPPPIPLPAGAWLLIGALGGLTLLRRRRRA